ncbi:MAG: TonB-dependent receptor [Undibacterium sp.]|nr:TonB-dependent receptor [Opitutaceae bacterium]
MNEVFRCLIRRLQSLALCVALALSTLIVSPSPSLRAQAVAEGSVNGSVRNTQTSAFLEGVVVSLDGTAFTTTTVRGGGFTFNRVPVGNYTLKTFYTGLDPKDTPVAVTAGQTVNVSVGLTSDVYKLEAFTVGGAREGNAASITKQRNALNVVNVVSMDAYGNVNDGNIGNFLQKLPGIAVRKEAGEIVGVGLRGTPPELNSVMLDGVRTAAAIAGFTPQGDRAALIDQIPSEFIKEIEVVKGNTPELPADSLGGSINLVTKSAFDYPGRVVSYRTGLSQNTYRDSLAKKFGPNAAVTVLDAFGPGRRLGVALSGSYSKTYSFRDRIQMQHAELDPRNTNARALDDSYVRARAGIGSKIEYRFDPTARFYVDASLNYFSSDLDRVNWQGAASNRLVADYNVVSRAAIEAGAVPRTTSGAAAGVAPGYTDTYTEMLNINWTNQVAKENKRSHQYKIGVGGEKKWTDSKLDVSASFNPSSYDNNFYGFTTTLAGPGLAIDTSRDSTRPTYTQTYGTSIAYGTDFNRYLAQRFEQPDITREEVSSLRADFEKKFSDLRFPVTFKTGVNYRHQHRWYRTYRPVWNYVGADGVRGTAPATGLNDDNIAQFRNGSPGYGLFNNRYPQRDKLNLNPVEAQFRSTPAYFAPNGTSVAFRPPASIASESVPATYVQGNVKFGALSVLGGVRYEATNVEAQGVFSDSLNPNQTVIRKEGDYAKYFPSIHFRYEPRRDLVMHASYSTSSARPAISVIVPGTTVSYNSSTGLGSVSQNNPGLKPQYTENFDASLEYYFEPAGVLSAGWFHKDVKDFIQGSTRIIGTGADNGFGGNYAGFDFSTRTNLGQAKISGFEFNYNQRLTGLPAPFNGLSVFANYTKLTTSGKYSDGANVLANFVPKTYNAGLSYDWRGFGARVEYHYKSAYVRDVDNSNFLLSTTVGDDPTVDLNFSYKLRPWLTVFADVVNVYNNSPDWFIGNRNRIVVSELYGTRLNIGISGRF